jgi:dipeptidyl aminopeptidase/acylaminoacyl peptidase
MATTIHAGSLPRQRPHLRIGQILFRALLVLLGVALVGYLGIGTYMADKMSHPVRKAVSTTPHVPYESVQFSSAQDGIPLKGWYLDAPGNKAILLVHGKGGVRDDTNIGLLDIGESLVGHGYAVLMFDFRAHGESGGDRYSLGQWEQRDIAGALTYLQSRGRTTIGALGYSMGAATLLLTAPAHPEIKALVADSAFSDLSKLLDVEIPKASGLPVIFNPGVIGMAQVAYGINVLDNKPVQVMPQLKDRPMMLIHSTTDTVIPAAHTQALAEAAAGNPDLQVWIAPGTGHVKSYHNQPTEYMQRVLAFFDRYLQ